MATSPKQDFTHSEAREPHRDRTRQILREHPEIRRLIGKNANTLGIIFALVSLQLALAAALSQRPHWWATFLVAYCVGAFIDHALFVMIHETTHNLVCRKRNNNMWAGILANLPLVAPSSVAFSKYHLKHHAFQGVYELDGDIPSHWEAKLVSNIWWRKALWLGMYPIIQSLRPIRLREVPMWDRWTITNTIVQVTCNVLLWWAFGWTALVYLTASLFFSVGFHPLGARWIQRHYLMDSEQETHSYYGPLNAVAFNVGYHNEHHDFPSVPWNRLPDVKRIAPEAYEQLSAHISWSKLLWRWVFDPNLSLYSRIVRENRGQVGLHDELPSAAEMRK